MSVALLTELREGSAYPVEEGVPTLLGRHVGSCWLIFPIFFVFFSFLVDSLGHLRPKSLPETIFLDFLPILYQFCPINWRTSG